MLDAVPIGIPSPALGTAAAARAAVPGADPLRKVAEDFESIFLFQVLDAMSAGIPTDGLFGGGPSEKIFRSMMNEEVAKAISARGGIGIGDAIYRELIRVQEGAGR